MKLPGDPWNNRWNSFYGIAWNSSMEFRGKCHNPPWKISTQKFPWNSMEIGVLMVSMGNVLILHEIFSMEIYGEISMEFRGN